jgi:hypothetical protein
VKDKLEALTASLQREPALQGSSLLHLGFPRLVKHCIIVANIDPNLLDKNGKTPLDALISVTNSIYQPERDKPRAPITGTLRFATMSRAGSEEERERERERWRRPLGFVDYMEVPTPISHACALLVKHGGMLGLFPSSGGR